MPNKNEILIINIVATSTGIDKSKLTEIQKLVILQNGIT